MSGTITLNADESAKAVRLRGDVKTCEETLERYKECVKSARESLDEAQAAYNAYMDMFLYPVQMPLFPDDEDSHEGEEPDATTKPSDTPPNVVVMVYEKAEANALPAPPKGKRKKKATDEPIEDAVFVDPSEVEAEAKARVALVQTWGLTHDQVSSVPTEVIVPLVTDLQALKNTDDASVATTMAFHGVELGREQLTFEFLGVARSTPDWESFWPELRSRAAEYLTEVELEQDIVAWDKWCEVVIEVDGAKVHALWTGWVWPDQEGKPNCVGRVHLKGPVGSEDGWYERDTTIRDSLEDYLSEHVTRLVRAEAARKAKLKEASDRRKAKKEMVTEEGAA